MHNHFDAEAFENEWTELAAQICQAIYKHPRIQKFKSSLEKNGFLTIEEKSSFIDICDMVKYQTIYSKYGPEQSAGYQKFSGYWKQWFAEKGVESQKKRGQRNSVDHIVDHIMFGSTPDPVVFLTKFDGEIGASTINN